MKKDVIELRVGKAIVRIHPGNSTEEERRAIVEEAATKLIKALWAAERKKNNGS